MATRMFDRRPAAALDDPSERVGAVVARHAELLTRVARSYSLCADDAQDAVQRALEIYMRRVESLDPATELAWLKVVVKHEALAVRRGRAGVAGEEVDLDAVPAVGVRSVEERRESAERVERSAEVMRRLKRDEARALMLKAEGLSYVEIGERLGWTYTKVNRCITEGRRRFMKLYAELETGVECERLAPTLVALASGTASSEALLELRPHLRNCPACRATVRQLHASRLRRLTAFLPFGALVAPARAVVERFRGARAVARGPGGRAAADGSVRARGRGLPPAERKRIGGPAGRPLGGGDGVAPLVGAREPARVGGGGAPAAPELGPCDERARGDERRRRSSRVRGGLDRGLRLGCRGRHLLRRNGAAAGPEAGDPGGGESGKAAVEARRQFASGAGPR